MKNHNANSTKISHRDKQTKCVSLNHKVMDSASVGTPLQTIKNLVASRTHWTGQLGTITNRRLNTWVNLTPRLDTLEISSPTILLNRWRFRINQEITTTQMVVTLECLLTLHLNNSSNDLVKTKYKILLWAKTSTSTCLPNLTWTTMTSSGLMAPTL